MAKPPIKKATPTGIKIDQAIRMGLALRRWNNQQLAIKAGVSTSTVSLWRNGRVTPSEETLERVAKAFDVPFVTLMGWAKIK